MPTPTYLLLRLTLVLCGLLTALVVLIRAQPYDDAELRAFLTPPDGCPMPCFMSIRPGVTTADEAVAILEVHEWVGHMKVYIDRTGHIYLLQWSWSGAQPPLIDGSKLAYISVRQDTVRSLTAETRIAFGDLWLALGKPDIGRMGSTGGQPPFLIQSAGYRGSSLGVQSMIPCPVHLHDFFQTTVVLSFIGDLEARFGDTEYQISQRADVRSCA